MVENLADKVRERPDDVQGWALLARSMNALGRYPEAVEAYEHLAKLVPNDPDVLADYADALGMAQGRNLAGQALRARAAGAQDRPDATRRRWRSPAPRRSTPGISPPRRATGSRSARRSPPGSEDEAKVARDPRRKCAAAPPPRASRCRRVRRRERARSEPSTVQRPTAAGAAVSGAVALAPALAAKVAPTDTLFIFARAEGGPRMPLAVLRGSAQRAAAGPSSLDDSMAMAPGMKLSSAQAVRIEARVSQVGQRHAAARRPRGHERRREARRARREDRDRQGPAVTAALLEVALARRLARRRHALPRRLLRARPPARSLAVRGPNGSGKTTLLRCVAGLTRADAGEIARARRACSTRATCPGIKDDLTPRRTCDVALRCAVSRRGRRRGAPGARARRPRQAPPRFPRAGSPRASAGASGSRACSSTRRRIWILDEPLTALDDEGEALLRASASQRHLERGGLALVATHHDAAARARRAS